MEPINFLHLAIALLGGPSRVARLCGVAHVSVIKWRKRGHLPRTEWTGETNYAERIEKALDSAITKAQLLSCPPTRSLT